MTGSMADLPVAYVHPVTVRMGHTDAAGIVYFARFFELASEAYEAFLAARGYAVADIIYNGAHYLPYVHAEADYKAAVRLGDALRIDVHVARVGAKSFTLEYRMWTGTTLCAKVRTVHAAVDRARNRAIPLPEALRAILDGASHPQSH